MNSIIIVTRIKSRPSLRRNRHNKRDVLEGNNVQLSACRNKPFEIDAVTFAYMKYLRFDECSFGSHDDETLASNELLKDMDLKTDSDARQH